MKPIYTAPSEDAAWAALVEFEASQLGQKYPQAVMTWKNSWERFTPFLQFPPMLRKVIYTTNSIESLNYQLRKVTKNRGHFPSTDAAVKLLWLAICNIEDKRAADRARDRGKPRQPAEGPGPARRGPDRHELEASPRPTRRGLPRPDHPLPVNTPLTQKS